jgi:hypothetical protein
MGTFGDVQHGRAEIEKAYDMLLHQTMPGAKVKQNPVLSSDLRPKLLILTDIKYIFDTAMYHF